jgi:hypothetical protein
MNHPHRNGRRKARQAAALERQAAYDALPLDAKVARAVERAKAARERIGVKASIAAYPTREMRKLGL